MPTFEYDFKERTEHIYDIMPDDEDGWTLGQYVCEVLSVDYKALSYHAASLLNECHANCLPYPDDGISAMFLSVFKGLSWEELEKLPLSLKNIYTTMRGSSRYAKDAMLQFYDSMEDYYHCKIWNFFNVIAVLQAYLEESMETPDMLIPEKFEVFISAAFDDHVSIVGDKFKGANLSDSDLDLELSPDLNIREMVRDVFANLMPLSSSGVVIQPTSLKDFVASSIFYFFRNGYRFKRCTNCGRFFIPFSRSDELYCDQPSPQDESRSCKQYGSERLWYDKLKQDEAAKLARNIYMAKQMLVKRNPDILGYKKMFEYFKTEKKRWEAWVKSGAKSKDEYIRWLNEMKTKKTL